MSEQYFYDITINVKENDIVDIKCGGPRYLGYDFKVLHKNGMTEGNLKKEVIKLLDTYSIPHVAVFVSKEKLRGPKYWSMKEISECLKKKDY